MTERQDREVDDSPNEKAEPTQHDTTPIWKGDAGEDGDDQPQGRVDDQAEGRVDDQPGAATAGAIAGASALGPLGGTIGAAAGGGLDIEDPDEATEK